jgi:TonB family protein
MAVTIAISLAVACASRRETHAVASTAFDPVETLSILPETTEHRVTVAMRQRGSLVYPSEARAQGVQAQAVVAFAIDTTGRIERGTMTFLQPVPPYAFQRALCDWSVSVRYAPPLVDGQRRRLLTVQPWNFSLGDRMSGRLPDMEPHMRYLRSVAPADAVAWLRGQPHCPE